MFKSLWIGGVAMALWSAVAMAQTADPEDLVNDVLTTAKPAELGEFWLGIGCAPVPPPLRAQLGLPDKQGLLVGEVVPGSPAAKAGIVEDDVLLRAGGKPLQQPRDLIQAVEAAKEGKLKLELIHGGKPKTVEATPARRPEEARRQSAATPAPGDWETMQRWLDRMWSGEEGDGHRPPMRFRFFHPGAIVPSEGFAPAPLPPNMSVVISKEGDQPAKIVVKRDDQKWEVTETELDKLPADVRPHVERMLGRGLMGIVSGTSSLDFAPKVTPPNPDRGPTAWQGRIEKRLDEMSARVDRILKQMEQRVESPAQPKASEKPMPEHRQEL